jgi:hypothetical protein
MIKYKFVDKKPTKDQRDEIEFYLKNANFIKILLLANTYYIQGYFADYDFKSTKDEGITRITITIY